MGSIGILPSFPNIADNHLIYSKNRVYIYPCGFFVIPNERFEMIGITGYHAKYFAYELTKKSSSDSLQKLATSLLDAQVDLNPHQVEAAIRI